MLLSCGLVIHVKARMLKATAKTKASNPRSGPRPDIEKTRPRTKKFGLKANAKD